MKSFGLSAKERIKKLNEFRKVFRDGRAVLSLDQKIKAYYFLIKNAKLSEVKIAVTINKKNGNAVWRNRLRRLIKESYRLSKKELLLTCSEKKCSLYLVINPAGFNKKQGKLKLNDTKFLVEDILKKIMAEL